MNLRRVIVAVMATTGIGIVAAVGLAGSGLLSGDVTGSLANEEAPLEPELINNGPPAPGAAARAVETQPPAPAQKSGDQQVAALSPPQKPAEEASKLKPNAAPQVAAKELFGKAATPAPLAARAIGFYAKGCLAGAQPLSIDGPSWQAMRLSRNRFWGHPDLIRLIERLAKDAKEHDGWPGLLVGDLSQPRGGPMLTGHASHQIGLDADIWLTPMPERRLSKKEREELSATSMLAADQVSVDPKLWTPAHLALIRRAASYPEVERVIVHPAIKQALCKSVPLTPANVWLNKVRPYWGHHYHMHVRIGCPADSTTCRPQAVPPAPADMGCGKELQYWLAQVRRPAPPPPPPGAKVTPAPPKEPPMTLDALPAECRIVLESEVPGPEATAKK